MSHGNARTTVFARRLTAECYDAGCPAARIAEQPGVSRATVYKWVDRFRVEGEAGLTWPASIPTDVIVSATTPFPTHEDAELWRKARQEFARVAPNRRLVVAEGSSHDIPADRPATVIDAVENMVKRAR
ncbi:helix-turn-helix domain-containing protein [Amycolatopsis cihanbeyliensis]|uniref:Transposase IS481 family protein n=1 Tax=Amycolatopsis cihanbeyliensis TaxID=1128664 RepID=A0A542DI13_AMYCI|nr:leucine zipper domain-containing protein [Amycolatopsis cihanbeyliensis]TQJ02713.1 transposase IS481 family protein [Amycolatopsis cihanbeyliensis]